jgi:hypothetical protein
LFFLIVVVVVAVVDAELRLESFVYQSIFQQILYKDIQIAILLMRMIFSTNQSSTFPVIFFINLLIADPNKVTYHDNAWIQSNVT